MKGKLPLLTRAATQTKTGHRAHPEAHTWQVLAKPMRRPTSAWIARWPVDSGTSVPCQTEPAVSVEREQGFLPSLATPARCRRVILDATGGPSDSATWPTWTSSTTAASLATSGIVRHTRPLNCMANVGLVRSLPRGCWRIYWPRTHAAPADRRASANEKTPLKLYQITILTTKQLHYPELSYHGRVAGNSVPLRITAWTCRDSNCHARHITPPTANTRRFLEGIQWRCDFSCNRR